MFLGETRVALLTSARGRELKDQTGQPLAANYTFAASDLKLIKPDGTIANAVNPPTPTPNSPIANLFDFTFDATEVATQVGQYLFVLYNPATLTRVTWAETVDAQPAAAPSAATIAAAVWDLIRTGHQLPNSFGEILDTRISAIVAQHVAATVAPGRPYSVVKGALEPDMEIDVVDLDGTPINLSTALSIQLRWAKPGAAATMTTLTAVDLVTGQMKRVWASGDTDVVGCHRGQVFVTQSNGELAIYPRDGSQYQWYVYTQLT